MKFFTLFFVTLAICSSAYNIPLSAAGILTTVKPKAQDNSYRSAALAAARAAPQAEDPDDESSDATDEIEDNGSRPKSSGKAKRSASAAASSDDNHKEKSKKMYTCINPLCGGTSHSTLLLAQHENNDPICEQVLKVYFDRSTFLCHVCNRTFSSKPNLDSHFKMCHQKKIIAMAYPHGTRPKKLLARTITCLNPYCAKEFSSRGSCNQHETKTTACAEAIEGLIETFFDESSSTCKICGKVIKQKIPHFRVNHLSLFEPKTTGIATGSSEQPETAESSALKGDDAVKNAVAKAQTMLAALRANDAQLLAAKRKRTSQGAETTPTPATKHPRVTTDDKPPTAAALPRGSAAVRAREFAIENHLLVRIVQSLSSSFIGEDSNFCTMCGDYVYDPLNHFSTAHRSVVKASIAKFKAALAAEGSDGAAEAQHSAAAARPTLSDVLVTSKATKDSSQRTVIIQALSNSLFDEQSLSCKICGVYMGEKTNHILSSHGDLIEKSLAQL